MAKYRSRDRVSAGDGLVSEGEDIEVHGLSLDHALEMSERGEIVDAKTIILSEHVKLHRLGVALRALPAGVRNTDSGR